jgi:hypothetical protein
MNSSKEKLINNKIRWFGNVLRMKTETNKIFECEIKKKLFKRKIKVKMGKQDTTGQRKNMGRQRWMASLGCKMTHFGRTCVTKK